VGDRAVELAGEPLGCVLARTPDHCVELLGDRLREGVRGPVDDALQLVDLPPLDVREVRLDPLHRLGLLGSDALDQLALALPQPVGDLVQRAPALALVGLELLLRALAQLADRLLELRLQGAEPLPLGLAGRVEALGVEGDSGLGLAHQLPLTLVERFDLRRQRLLRALEVGSPLGESAPDALLDLPEGLGELRTRAILAVDERGSPFLCDAALLAHELRERVGARPGERALDLGDVRVGLLRDERVQASLRLGELALDVLGPAHEPLQRERAELGCRTHGQPGRRNRELTVRLEGEGDPDSDGG
jgi:hypothetical protein